MKRVGAATGVLALVLAGLPATARASEPSPAQPVAAEPEPAPSTEPAPDYQPGWDEPIPTTAPTAEAPAAPPPPVATPEPEREVVAENREGRGLLIGAGVAAGIGLVANAIRIYTVTVPCQTDTQRFCSGPWTIATIFAWAPNNASLVLAGVGASLRGKHDATLDPQRHRQRSRGLTAAGAVLLGTGALANILLRVAWFSDWVSPEGPEIFDFARPGQAIGYYGGLQLSSMMMAAGIGSLTYAGARPRKRQVSVAPMGYGLQLTGRF